MRRLYYARIRIVAASLRAALQATPPPGRADDPEPAQLFAVALPRVLAPVARVGVGDVDALGLASVAVNDQPVLDAVVVTEDQAVVVDAALDVLELEVVAHGQAEAFAPQLAHDRALAGAM